MHWNPTRFSEAFKGDGAVASDSCFLHDQMTQGFECFSLVHVGLTKPFRFGNSRRLPVRVVDRPAKVTDQRVAFCRNPALLNPHRVDLQCKATAKCFPLSVSQITETRNVTEHRGKYHRRLYIGFIRRDDRDFQIIIPKGWAHDLSGGSFQLWSDSGGERTARSEEHTSELQS